MVDNNLSEGASAKADQALVASPSSRQGVSTEGFDPSRITDEARREATTRMLENQSFRMAMRLFAAPFTDRLMNAFNGDWERLRDVAERIGSHTRHAIGSAQRLQDAGLLETRLRCGHLQWRPTAIAMDARSVEAAGLHPKDDSAGRNGIAQP
jgi:hypothetical protein